ncbi:MAG: hypothetical protein GQF41_3618 [Candidatus Rifleibacterium amylolyticum]|nr:MAG: hypothetical protein GQF41_3618 [Candidatus Rifleibacterium amylolyticum]
MPPYNQSFCIKEIVYTEIFSEMNDFEFGGIRLFTLEPC